MGKGKKLHDKKQKIVLDVQNSGIINENVTWSNLKLKKPIELTAKTEHQKLLFKSIKENLITFAVGSAGSGKSQPLSETVYTPHGPKKMGDIEIGDKVCTPDGKTARVLGIFPQGKISVFKVIFADGDFVFCSGDHLWRVMDRDSSYKEDIYTTSSLMDIINKSERGSHRLQIRTPSYCNFNKKKTKIDPYLMGILLGDGCLVSNSSFSSSDKQIIDYVEETVLQYGCFVKKSSGKYDYSITTGKRGCNINNRNEVTAATKHYDLFGKLSNEKFIPKDYIYNSKKNRIALIQGLMDTDGTVNKKSGVPSFHTTSKQLALDFKELIESLGGICVITEKKPFYRNENEEKIMGKICYACFIRYNNSKELFKLKRKKDLAKNRSKYLTKRIINEIVFDREEECQCILIDHPEHLYLTSHFIPTHNTLISVNRCLDEFIKGNYDKMIFTRPCIEANGENLGFLPGNLNEKIYPYMMPIFDFLGDYLDYKQIEMLIKENRIQTLPLAYMRGVTFRNAFVLADEFQNTKPEQMKMFLTRIGDGCKIVITGDPKQSDIKGKNGLSHAIELLSDVDGIGVVKFNEDDILRHPMVAIIEKKYNGYSSNCNGNGSCNGNVS